jgi:hypothetical protein
LQVEAVLDVLRAKGPTEKVVVFTEFKPLLQVGGAGNARARAGAAAAGLAVLMVAVVMMEACERCFAHLLFVCC